MGMYSHLNTIEELEAELERLNAEAEEVKKMSSMPGLVKGLTLKMQIEQVGWRFGEITGHDFMNA